MASAIDGCPMSLLPSDSDVVADGESRVVGLDGEEADVLLDALSSEKGRRLFLALKDEPAPPGELAERLDVSLQNAQYHLNKLEDAGVIEVVDTAYSEKGREMDVYGPADDPLLIFVGEQAESSGLRTALSRLFAGWLAIGLGAVVIQELFGRSLLMPAADSGAPPAGRPTATSPAGETATSTSDATPTTAPDATPTAGVDVSAGGGAGQDGAVGTTTTPDGTATPTPDVVTPSPGDGVGPAELLEGLLSTGMPPGVAFFLGGSIVLTLLVGIAYVQRT